MGMDVFSIRMENDHALLRVPGGSQDRLYNGTLAAEAYRQMVGRRAVLRRITIEDKDMVANAEAYDVFLFGLLANFPLVDTQVFADAPEEISAISITLRQFREAYPERQIALLFLVA